LAWIPVVFAVLGVLTLPTRISAAPAAPVCDQSLWTHVYVPERLKIVKSCVSVTGVIESIQSEPDGDYQMRVKLDQQYSNMTNISNRIFQHGDIVVEAICSHEANQSNAKAACGNFHQNLQIPPIGTHVEIVGSYVLDQPHLFWAEIHPITAIMPINQS
jgi:hypothetical protein